jgi:hypothetical protein
MIEKRRKKHARLSYQTKSLPLQSEFGRVALPSVRSNRSPTYILHWRLTPSYAAKDTIFWRKRPKTIVIGMIVQDNKNSNLFIWPSMWTRLTLSSFQRSNWSPTYILHLFHLEDTSLLFIFLSESVKVHFLPRVDTFSFAQEPHVVYCFETVCMLNASKLALKWQRFCLIDKPNMFFPSFLNRFSYFMNLWWCLWS